MSDDYDVSMEMLEAAETIKAGLARMEAAHAAWCCQDLSNEGAYHDLERERDGLRAEVARLRRSLGMQPADPAPSSPGAAQ